jgi:CRP/FNR family transcriptional regulator, anaerobic regulatory protein
MNEIRQYFNRFLSLTDQEWADFEKCLNKETLPKKSAILEKGKICDFIAFIEAGSFRFYYEKEGEEKITAFFFKGDFVTNYRSFLTRQPSEHSIESMQDAVIYKIHRKDLQALYDKHKNVERLGRLIAENLYLIVAKRLDSFLYATPEERYHELLHRNSKLLQEVPQYMIASYLGVKPETLSRIRSRK